MPRQVREYSAELKAACLVSLALGCSTRQVGKHFDVPATTIASWRAEAVRSGIIGPDMELPPAPPPDSEFQPMEGPPRPSYEAQPSISATPKPVRDVPQQVVTQLPPPAAIVRAAAERPEPTPHDVGVAVLRLMMTAIEGMERGIAVVTSAKYLTKLPAGSAAEIIRETAEVGFRLLGAYQSWLSQPVAVDAEEADTLEGPDNQGEVEGEDVA